MLWLAVKLLAVASLAKALDVRPPRKLALRWVTCVVEVTASGAVPVAIVETNCLPVTLPEKVPAAADTPPVALRDTPVSAGAAAPGANNRFSFPDGDAVLFPTGSACQRKC